MRWLLLAVVLCVRVVELKAQCQPEPRSLAALGMTPAIGRGLIQGGSIERHQAEGSLAFAYRATEFRPRSPGLDFGVGIWPRYLGDRLLAATLDLGLAQGTTVGGSLLFLRGGGGALVLAGAGGGDIRPALQAGLALMVPLDPRTALRLDLGQHWYWVDREFERRWSVGVGFAVLPPRR